MGLKIAGLHRTDQRKLPALPALIDLVLLYQNWWTGNFAHIPNQIEYIISKRQ